MIESVFPKHIMIQTSSFCNAICGFCPYPETKDFFPQGVMNDALFEKIASECKEYSHITRIMPYLMNEPLTDKKIANRIDCLKSNNPDAWIHFLSNGALLNNNTADKILNSSLDQICFSVYGIDPSLYKRVMGLDLDLVISNILKFKEKADKAGKSQQYVMITFFKWQGLDASEAKKAVAFWREHGISEISVFDGPISRAGNVGSIAGPHKKKIAGCNSIWCDDMVHILYNGDVVLCCMDWRRSTVVGNVSENTIYEIWHSDRYRELREKVLGLKKSADDFLCKRCESSYGS